MSKKSNKKLAGFYKATEKNIKEVAKQAIEDVEAIQSNEEAKRRSGIEDNYIEVASFNRRTTNRDHKQASDLSCALNCLQNGETDEFILNLNIPKKTLDKAKRLRKEAEW